MQLREEVEIFSIKNNLIEKGDCIVLGVSGGPDSMCLLSILNDLKDKYDLKLIVVHINHSLRPEADFEENFVRDFSAKSGLEFYSKKVDIAELKRQEQRSTEEIARDIRYDFFNEIACKVNANKIAVAHNKNDNAETVLMNIIRGCGVNGLTGISSRSGNLIRPLIAVSREKIEEYCNEFNLKPMIDKTNYETVYTRNKVRNLLIPLLKGMNPDIISGLARLSNVASEEEDLIDECINEKYQDIVKCENGEVIINKTEFNRLGTGVKRRILRKAIYDFRDTLKDIGFATIDNAIDELKDAKNGGSIKVAKDVKIFVDYNNLKLISQNIEFKDYIYEVKIPGTTYIPEINSWVKTEVKNADEVGMTEKDRNKHFFDIAKTGQKLYVRNRKNGDYFYPAGMEGRKKLKDFLSDEKIPTEKRGKIAVLTNDEEIVWVMGMRSSKKFLKDKDTKEVIIINYGENI